MTVFRWENPTNKKVTGVFWKWIIFVFAKYLKKKQAIVDFSRAISYKENGLKHCPFYYLSICLTVSEVPIQAAPIWDPVYSVIKIWSLKINSHATDEGKGYEESWNWWRYLIHFGFLR